MSQQRASRRFVFAALALALFALSAWSPASAQAPSDLKIAPPSIPGAVFRVTDYGTVGDGKTLDTQALQKAIDTCSKAGGGTVVVPAGRYLTGPLHLGSSMNLHLEKGATLLLSGNTADYKLANNRFED